MQLLYKHQEENDGGVQKESSQRKQNEKPNGMLQHTFK